MQWKIAAIMLGLWLCGLMNDYTLGGLIHLLLVLPVGAVTLAVVVRILEGRQVSE